MVKLNVSGAQKSLGAHMLKKQLVELVSEHIPSHLMYVGDLDKLISDSLDQQIVQIFDQVSQNCVSKARRVLVRITEYGNGNVVEEVCTKELLNAYGVYHHTYDKYLVSIPDENLPNVLVVRSELSDAMINELGVLLNVWSATHFKRWCGMKQVVLVLKSESK